MRAVIRSFNEGVLVKKLRKHLTYANVMSSLAVFLIVGGAGAVAANKINGKRLKANSVPGGKLKKSTIPASRLKRNSVARNKIRNTAVNGPKIANSAVNTDKIVDNAVTGAKADESTFSTVPSAETAAPRAFARVLNATGGLGIDEPRSKGVTDADVTFVGGSVYCFELGFTPKNIQATVDWIGGGANTFAQATLEPFAGCPAGTDASVRTTRNDGTGIGTINFYVTFDD